MNMFKKASKLESKLRLALFGTSGSGKTYSALSIAQGLGGKIALIDTERGSASKYADRFDFDVAELEIPNIDNYVNFIKSAKDYDVIIIDSLTHGWQELLQEVDRISKTSYRGNSWAAWNEGTPKQKSLINAILSFNGHLIATMRSKTEWTFEEIKGKKQPIRIGLAPEQGKGIEYEFDVLMEINPEHKGTIIKDRTGKFQDTVIDKPGVEFGKELASWLGDGIPLSKINEEKESEKKGRLKELQKLVSIREVEEASLLEYYHVENYDDLTIAQIEEAIVIINKKPVKVTDLSKKGDGQSE